jgi:hypothetical protein
MTRKRWWVVIGAVAGFAAVAGGLSLAFTGGDRSGGSSDTRQGPGLTWEQRFSASRVGARKEAVLALWPRIPYQHYSDNLKEDCYEWQGDNLYDLCFLGGVLHLKTTF